MRNSYTSEDATRAIAELRAVLLNPYCRAHMNTSGLKGFLGELLLRELLQHAGHTVRHLGNQHGTDLQLPAIGLSIDVKTSTQKEEIPGCQHWGWALVSGSKTKALNFTHVVCVALDETLALGELFVVRKDELHEFPGSIPPFTKNKHILVVPVAGHKPSNDAKPLHKQLLDDCAALERRGRFRRARNAAELMALLTVPASPEGAG